MLWRLFSGHFDGAFCLDAAHVRQAPLRQRTRRAVRLARRADQRAEFHQSLVQVTGPPGRGSFDERVGSLPQPLLRREGFRLIGDVIHPAEYAADVAIQDRLRPAKSQAEDRSRRVAADAGQAEQRFPVRRDFTSVLGYDFSRRRLQVASTGVVA